MRFTFLKTSKTVIFKKVDFKQGISLPVAPSENLWGCNCVCLLWESSGILEEFLQGNVPPVISRIFSVYIQTASSSINLRRVHFVVPLREQEQLGYRNVNMGISPNAGNQQSQFLLVLQWFRGPASLRPLAHACNPGSLRGWDQEVHYLKTSWANSMQDPTSKITNTNELEVGLRW